jgi:hypothetical protein
VGVLLHGVRAADVFMDESEEAHNVGETQFRPRSMATKSARLMVCGGGVDVEGGGSSRTVTRLHTMIGLTGHRTRDLLRIRRAFYRVTEKA